VGQRFDDWIIGVDCGVDRVKTTLTSDAFQAAAFAVMLGLAADARTAVLLILVTIAEVAVVKFLAGCKTGTRSGAGGGRVAQGADVRTP
jgi:hypothetical protein